MNFQWSKNFTTSIFSSVSLPDYAAEAESSILFFDENVLSNPLFDSWRKLFPFQVSLCAGEQLKSLESLKETLEIISSFEISHQKNVKFVCVGGGSLGDFVGFIASVFKRGVELHMLPSTWLSAIDSAHGGKTALNLQSAKNQIGSFYPATKIFLVKDILKSQPTHLAAQGLSEFYKMTLIDDEYLNFKSCIEQKNLSPEELIWTYLLDCVRAKYKVVLSDPFETSGLRQVLNLGHSFGHIIEAKFHLTHGEAIAHGLLFAVKWSAQRFAIDSLVQIHDQLQSLFQKEIANFKIDKISKEDFLNLAKKDKKRSSAESIQFVFVRDCGDCVIEKVSLEEFLQEAIRQGVVLE